MDFFDAEYATEAAKNAVDLLERMFSQFRYFGPLEGSGTVYLLIDTEISERHLAGALHKHALVRDLRALPVHPRARKPSMNKTYQELCDEVLMLREQLEDKRRAADSRCAKLARDLEDAKALAHETLNANLLLRLERRAAERDAAQGDQGPVITEGAA